MSAREPTNAELLAAINAGRAETAKLIEGVHTALDGIREDLTVLDDRTRKAGFSYGGLSASCQVDTAIAIYYLWLAILQSNANIVFDCKYHVVFCPKYRRKVLVEPMDNRLKEIVHSMCVEMRVRLVELEVMPDHVHLLLAGVDPQFGIHRLIKRIKGRSSRLLRQEFPALRSRLPTLWTNSYFVSTVGGAPLAVIKRYIENQKSV